MNDTYIYLNARSEYDPGDGLINGLTISISDFSNWWGYTRRGTRGWFAIEVKAVNRARNNQPAEGALEQ